MQTTIQKIGNSKGMILPSGIINYFSFNERDVVDLEVSREGIFIRPIKTKRVRKTLAERFEGYTGDYQPEELNTGMPVGSEIF